MKHLFFICSLLFSSALAGQVSVQDTELLEAVGQTPQEEIFVHYNSSLFFAGEYLYYKTYCLESGTGEFSDLSKIAYVELVGEGGTLIFRHKLVLEEGVGQGDFFIPPSVASGNYKLLGYTRWMLNREQQQLFEADLVIVNPYTNAQDALLTAATANGSSHDDLDSDTADLSPSGLVTDADTYGLREKVEVTLQGLQEQGKYSLSVRKLEKVQAASVSSSKERFPEPSTVQIKVSSPVYLPEMRGELFTGSIVPKQGSAVSPANRAVALSLPDENYILKISGTDDSGRFFFNVENYNLEDEGVFQVLGEDGENFEVALQEPQAPDYSGLHFRDFHLTPEMEEMIIARSVYNQVENAYFEAKPDTLKISPKLPPFYGEGMQIYALDDYTRFKTIRVTVVEILKFVSLGKDARGDDVFRIVGHNQTVNSSLPPLLIVDGVMVQEQGDLIHFPAERIKSIGILRDKYFLGAEVFQGVVNVETMEGNFNTGRNKEYQHSLKLLRPEPKKYYFRQTYSEEDRKARIPDFRTQLLWEPELDKNSLPSNIEFFTSDIPGDYEISLEGFTTSGEPVSLRSRIRVE